MTDLTSPPRQYPHRSLGWRMERVWAPWITLGGGLLAGVGALLAGPEPTALAAVDVLWVLASAVVLVAAFARARRWAWLTTTGLLAVTAADLAVLAVALVAVVIGIAAARSGQQRRKVVGVVVGILATQVAYRQRELAFQGGDLLWGLAACTPVLVSGYANARSRARRVVRWTAAGVLAFVALGAALFAVVALPARSDLEVARKATADGLSALQAGEQEEAVRQLEVAADRFADARSGLDGPLALPLAVVPGASQHVVAARQVSVSGTDIADAAVAAATTAPYQDLKTSAGRLDLGLVAAMQPPVAEVAATLATAQADLDRVRSPWLVPPVGDQLDDVIAEVDDNLPDAELAAEAMELLPALFGGEGPRRYLVAFATPAETRFLGGFVGGYGILTAVDGKVELASSGRVSDLGVPDEAVVDLAWPEDLENRYNRWDPARFLYNGTVTPDFPTDAALMRDVAPGYGLGAVDGVVYVDPIGLAALLRLTGPVRVDRLDEPVRPKDVADLLLREQYLDYGSNDERSDLLTDVAEATFERLTTGDLPGPGKVADVLSPAVAGGHLLFETFQPGEQGFLERVGTRGAFPPEAGTDLVSLRMSNDGGSKLDAYVERDVTYDVVLDPASGTTTTTVTAVLRNTAPRGLPDYVVGAFQAEEGSARGDDLVYLSLYSPDVLTGASQDGAQVGVETQVEGALTTYSRLVTIPRGGQVEVRFELTGQLAPDGRHALAVVPQALANDDQVEVRIRAADRSHEVVATAPAEVLGGVATVRGPLTELLTVEAMAVPDGR